MRFLLLTVFIALNAAQVAFCQVNILINDSVDTYVPGKNGVQKPRVNLLSKPYITTFKGVKEIIPGITELVIENKIFKTHKPYIQQVLGNPTVNNGLEKTELPIKTLLNYTSNHSDSAVDKKGYVEKIKASLPKTEKAGNPMHKEKATINLKYLDIAQGLFSSYIMALERDSLGTIWMGTYGAGLVSYDGLFFRQYSIDQGLKSDKILSLHIDSRNRIWIGTFDDGLFCFNGLEFHHYSTNTGLPGNKVRSIAEDKDGRIWVGTDNGLSAIHNNTLLVYGKAQGLDVRQIYDIAIGENDELWIGTFNMGLIMFDGISFFQYSFINGLFTSAIWSVETDENGDVWMGTFGEGIVKFDGNKFTQYSTKQGIGTTEFYRVNKDAKQNLWFCSDGGGVIKFDGKSFSQINSSHGLTNDIIWDIIDDPAGNYWIASYGGGLMKYDGGKIQYLTQKQGLRDNIALSFAEDSNQNMWIGTWGEGITKYDGQNLYTWNTNKGLTNNTIWDLVFDQEKNLWIATEGSGLAKISNNLITTYTTDNGLSHNEITALLPDNGGIWAGSYKGLNYIKNGKILQYGKKQGLEVSEIKDIYKDRYGDLWIASSDYGLAVLSKNKFFHINENHGLTSNVLYDIYEDNLGNIWLATNNKINIIPSAIVDNIHKIMSRDDYKELTIELYEQLKNNIKIIGKEQGLSTNVTRAFIQLDNESIWVGTEKGITKFISYNKDVLNIPLININGNYYNIENVGYQHGFIGGDVFANHSVGKDTKGNIWWGTGKMITLMNSSKNTSNNIKPGIQINSVDLFYESICWVSTGDNSPANQISKKITFHKKPIIEYSGVNPWNFLPQNLTIGHQINHITFNFNGLDWNKPEKLEYQFILVGYEENWNPLTHQHKSTYSNLGPGNYTFKVKSIDQYGHSSTEALFSFKILPPWWQTLWFRITAVIIILVIVYLAYQWRIASFKHRQKELELQVNERTTEITEKNEELLQQTEEILAQRNEIESQKNQLEIVHDDLMESIEYAHFIQNSMMPTKPIKDIDSQFVLFQPKERISGDFFWWTIIENRLIATVADCTGHGVPGALMSMLGISFLREIVLKEQCFEPAIILNKLRQEVIAVLDQRMERGVQKDGMDMALISIDLNNLNGQFAGARNTLVLIRDGELQEFSSDKAPISIYLKMRDFTQKEIQFKKGDQIYLFTDGFPDQFNGENGKKFKRSRFKELLLSISHKPMREQQDELITHFENWQGVEDQIDDVTVVGFKL